MKLKLPVFYILLLIASYTVFAQDIRIVPPQEVPSQNLLEFNRYFINPIFSRVGLKDSYVSLYTRNQWVQFDDAPTIYLLNYTSRVNENTGVGLGIQQQNNGILNYFGINANYAYGVQLSEKSWLTLGTNLSYLDSGIKSSAVTADSDPLIANFEEATLLTFKPGINLTMGRFDIGFYAENLIRYNLKTNEQADGPQIFSGHLMYSQPLTGDNRLNIMARGRKNENGDAIISGNLLLDVPNLGWAQAGYDDFYGGSIGLGINLSDHISIGYVLEKGLSGTTNNLGVTHELTLAYRFRDVSSDVTLLDDMEASLDQFAQDSPPKEFDTESINDLKNEVAVNTQLIEDLQYRQDSIQRASKATSENQLKQMIAMQKVEDHMKKPSSSPVKPKVPASKKIIDTNEDDESWKSPSKIKTRTPSNRSVPTTNAMFNSLESTNHPSGYYLVGNIFRNKNYARSFYEKLKADGFENSVYLKDVKNGLNYVAMTRFSTLREAEEAYLSNLGGSYNAPISILEIKDGSSENIAQGTYTADSKIVKPNSSKSDDVNSAFAKAEKPQNVTTTDESVGSERSAKTEVSEIAERGSNKNQKEQGVINDYDIAIMQGGSYKAIYGTYSDLKSVEIEKQKLVSKGVQDIEVFKDESNSSYYLLYGVYPTESMAHGNKLTKTDNSGSFTKKGVLEIGKLKRVAIGNPAPTGPVKADKPKTLPADQRAKESEPKVEDVKATIRSEKLNGLEKGYYIIANVYSKNYYFNRFMKNLKSQSLDPKYFENPDNNFKYVYLKYAETYEEVAKSYRSQLDGTYKDKIWVLEIE